MNNRIRTAAIFVVIVCSTLNDDDRSAAAEFECRFATGPIVIDGRGDDDAWQSAQLIDRFTLPWLGADERAAKTATHARLLWDRNYLYFFAELEDHDLFADITEHDGRTWHNDVFELFFKPDDEKTGYYEFQVNAAGTTMDMFIPERQRGAFEKYIGDGEFLFEAKVIRRGTLDKRDDRDSGWTAEGRIPWWSFLRTGGRPDVGEVWTFALCRFDYSIDSEKPELSTSAPLSSQSRPDFHHHEDYAPLRFVGPTSATFSNAAADQKTDPLAALKMNSTQVESRVIGSPDPPLPYRVQRALPELKLSFPIFVIREPGSRRLMFIDQGKSYGPARLCRTTADPASGEYEILLDADKGVRYSIAFHPNYRENGYLYIGDNYPDENDVKRSRVARYTVDREAPFKLDPESALVIIEWESNGHNGAAIDFGLDGMLYVTSGDGTSDSDTNLMGQGLDHLLAKVLRIDVDHPAEGQAYSVPPDNPFVDQPNVRPETWAYGMRNPWRMSVDPQTGHVWVGNNGQDLWEQIYLVEKGANYGWSVYEGSHIFYANRKLGPTPHVKPTFEHHHSVARSLTGGVVYFGKKLPELHGAYIYGDYSTGKIWGAKVDGNEIFWHKELADSILQISGFGLDADGELLIVDHQGDEKGGFYSLVPNDTQANNEDFPRSVAASGLFVPDAGHEVVSGMIPYSVNTPLWSDGTSKERYLFLPNETSDAGERDLSRIEFPNRRGWNLPDLSVLVKSFAIETEEGNPDSRRWIETRFLTKQQGEWVGYSYAWDEQQQIATLVPAEGRDETFAIRSADGTTREQKWHYPSRTECMVCHSRAANFVLGLSTLQMNRVHDYGSVSANQLDVLEYLGALRIDGTAAAKEKARADLKQHGLSKQQIDAELKKLSDSKGQREAQPSQLLAKSADEFPHLVDPYDESQPVDTRARSYLEANCAHCHVGAGGGNSQIELAFTTPLDKMVLIDEEPLHHRFGIENARLVDPGDPERSVLLHRMAIREQGQMPQLATTIPDQRAVALIREWIAQMPAGSDAD